MRNTESIYLGNLFFFLCWSVPLGFLQQKTQKLESYQTSTYCSLLSSKGCAKANTYIKDFHFHRLLSFTYITLLDNGAKAEHPHTIVSISPYLTTEAELFVHKLPSQRMCIQVLYSRVTTRAYSTQDVWMLCWTGLWFCLLCTGKNHHYKAASTDCVSQGHLLQDPNQNIKVGVFWS